MGKNKVVTTEMILAKKGLIEQAPAPFYSEFFGGEIVVENTHGDTFAQILAMAQSDEMYANSRLIYENCPIFRNKDLLSEYEIDDPFLLPKKIYGSNVVEFLQLGDHILKIYGLDSKKITEVKKK